MTALPAASLGAEGSGARVRVPSEVFGPLDVPEDECLTFPDGLLGFAAQRRYVLLPAAAEGVFWLQSCEEGSLVFLVVDPFAFVPDYAVSLPESLGAGEDARDGAAPSGAAVLAIVTLPRAAGEPATANLQGPIVVDPRTRTACQRVLGDGAYPTKHPIDLERRLRETSSSGAPRR